MARLRSALRISVPFLFVALLYHLGQTLWGKKTAYTCRTARECLMLGTNHKYRQSLPIQEPVVSAIEHSLRDGTLKFERTILATSPSLLFLALVKDGRSWSTDVKSSRRSVYDFLDVLISTNLNLTDTSLSLMTASLDEYQKLKTSASELPFGRITIFYQQDVGPDIPYLDRHKPELQLQRRAHIAKMRNYLMIRALDDEQHVLWIDADIARVSPNVVQTMVHHSDTNLLAGIITARCQHNFITNYDKNAWQIDRYNLTVMGSGPADDKGKEAVLQQFYETRRYITEVMDGTTDDELRPLDAVGGTILYIRADLVRQGANFPTMNIVGTSWNSDGWVGVETEGLCYTARTLVGGRCWILGGTHHVRHSDVG